MASEEERREGTDFFLGATSDTSGNCLEVAPMLRLLGFSEELCQLSGNYAMYNVFWPIPNGWYQSHGSAALAASGSDSELIQSHTGV